MALTVEQISLGADQLGEFYTGVVAAFKHGRCEQSFITRVRDTKLDDEKVEVDVFGSKGATLLAVLDDNGWEIEPVI